MQPLDVSKISKSIVFRFLNKIKHGKIIVHEGQQVITFTGTMQNPDDCVIVYIRRSDVYKKILLGGSVAAGESFIQGDWDTTHLTKLIEIFIRNSNLFDAIDQPISKFFNFSKNLIARLLPNNIRRAKKNILAHYDLGDYFFSLFLDRSMMYSCALYEPSDISLDKAAENKIKKICDQLELKSSDHVLEIGCGWGGFAIYAAKQFGCKITATTISDKQFAYVKNKIANLDLENQIEVLNVDYRNLVGSYDKIVSIEMIEAVGCPYFDLFFNICNRLLKVEGLFFLQSIVINDQAFNKAKNEIDFIKKYIFPGGCLPSVQAISTCIASQTNFQLLAFKDIGKHYVKTLNDWHKNFDSKKDEVLAQGFNEEFIRMWQYYFAYCMAGFSTTYISDIQALWRKRK